MGVFNEERVGQWVCSMKNGWGRLSNEELINAFICYIDWSSTPPSFHSGHAPTYHSYCLPGANSLKLLYFNANDIHCCLLRYVVSGWRVVSQGTLVILVEFSNSWSTPCPS